MRSNYFWAPDASHIAYLQMDESAVPEYPIVDWLSRELEIDRQRYPKAGETNPSVRIGVVDLDGHSKWLSFTTETDIYIPRFGWLNPRVVWALVLNRAQNRESLYFIDIESGESRLTLSETEEPYIEMNDLLRFFRGQRQVSVAELARRAHASLFVRIRRRESALGSRAAGATGDAWRLGGARSLRSG